MSTANTRPAIGLPGHYYYSPEIYQQERSQLWWRAWHIVGRAEDLAAGGDYLTMMIGDEPVAVTRDHDGRLQALSNVCAHRGTRLLEGQGNSPRIQCPYHGWSYELDGQLKSVPHKKCFPDLCVEEIRLNRMSVETWGGFIFVRPEPSGASLETDLAGITQRWSSYDVEWPALRQAACLTFEQPFNWKIFNENFIDYYHIPYIHPETLEMPGKVGNAAFGQHFGTTIHRTGYFNLFDLIFPNMFFHVSRLQVQFYRVVPLRPDACRIELKCYQTPVQAEKYPLGSGVHRDIGKILDEDSGVCRILQEQARSRSFHVGYTAREFEEGVHHFHQTIINSLRSPAAT